MIRLNRDAEASMIFHEMAHRLAAWRGGLRAGSRCRGQLDREALVITGKVLQLPLVLACERVHELDKGTADGVCRVAHRAFHFLKGWDGWVFALTHNFVIVSNVLFKTVFHRSWPRGPRFEIKMKYCPMCTESL